MDPVMDHVMDEWLVYSQESGSITEFHHVSSMKHWTELAGLKYMVVANGTVLPNTMLSLAVEQREDLEQRFKLLSAMRVSGGTAYNYGVGARAFVRFALFYGCTPILPASDLTLARFIAFQSQSCSRDTLQTYISHIRDLHLRAGYDFAPTASRFLVSSTLMGIRRAFGTPKKRKLAITLQMLRDMHAAILDGSFVHKTGHTYGLVSCVWAAILVGFFGMLRKDNVCSGKARTFNPRRCLLRGDLVFVPETVALWLRCRFSKTNQFNERMHCFPLQYSGGELCPVTTYLRHVEMYPSTDPSQPAFMYDVKNKRTALSHTCLVTVLKQMLSNIGINPALYSGHSLRRGGATLAFQLGAHPEAVMLLGDWRSLVVLEYNDAQPDFLQALPGLLAKAAL